MRRSIGLVLGTVAVAALLAGCSATNVTATALALRVDAHCSLPAGAPSIALTDTSPSPSLHVRVGDRFVVTVPPWSSTHASTVTIGTPGIAVELCTLLLPDGGRQSVFIAAHAGITTLAASVAPASGLFMPAWGGRLEAAR
jgi:hypothetical protein